MTLVCVHVHLCRCPADVRRRHFYLGGDGPSGWSLTLLNERMTSAQKKSKDRFTLGCQRKIPPLRESHLSYRKASIHHNICYYYHYFDLSEHPGVQSGGICGRKILFFCWVRVCIHMVTTSTWWKEMAQHEIFSFLSKIFKKTISYPHEKIKRTPSLGFTYFIYALSVGECVCTFGKHGQNIRAAPAPGVSALIKHRVKLDWILLPP